MRARGGPRGVTNWRVLACVAIATQVGVLLLAPELASAHALVGKKDLPIPTWLFAWAASIVLIVSFFALSYGWKEPRLEDDRWRSKLPTLSEMLPVFDAMAGAVGVFLLGLVIYAGLDGTGDPVRNFSIVFVFVTFWLGMVALSVLFGNVFRAFNPWRAIARLVSGGFRLIAGQPGKAPFTYPERLGRWPAAFLLLAFVWLELVWGAGGISIGLLPKTVAEATLVYSAFTFVGMATFGIDRWLSRAEMFSVYFEMFSRLAAFEVREGRIGVRRMLSSAGSWATVPGSAAVVIASIAGTSFDGAQEGALGSPIASMFRHFQDAGLGPVFAFRLSETVFMALAVVIVAAIYGIGVWGMRTIDRDRNMRELSTAFAHTLIPIALAYLVAHYFSLVVYQEQAQFGYLLSDPLGHGADLFGTASGGINYGAITATAVWYVQVGVLVAGHVTGLTMAHDRAIKLYGDPKTAARSQYWMLSVMVAFTCLGLYLLSQGNA